MSSCRQELCEYWTGDGCVCTCALLDIDPSQTCLDCGAPTPGQCDDCARRDEAHEAARDDTRDGGGL